MKATILDFPLWGIFDRVVYVVGGVPDVVFEYDGTSVKLVNNVKNQLTFYEEKKASQIHTVFRTG